MPTRQTNLSRWEETTLRAALGVLGVTILATGVVSLVVPADSPLVGIARDWASSFAYVLSAAIVAARAIRVSHDRLAWVLISLGLALYAAGGVLWAQWLQGLDAPPIPSASDVLWLSLYPLCYGGVVLLARRDGKRLPAGVWLDGIVGGLGIAALGAAVVFTPVLTSASGGTGELATQLAYPVADLLLAALVIGVLALRGWRMDRAWSLIGAGFLMLCGADCIYLLQVAGGATDASLLGNVFYMGATALLALAAWQPRSPDRDDRLEGSWVLLIPSAFALCAVALLIYGQLRPIGVLAEVLANATLLAALARTVLTFRDLRALAETRHQAHTDELTGLPNRRLFFARVQEEIASSPVGTRLAVLLVDLDHFKELNDTLGHATGDQLLAQIGPRLRSSVREGDTVARLGGDEFGILLPAPMDEPAARKAAGRVRWALTQPFLIDELHLQVVASVGVALYPDHGASGDELLQRADVAMYEAKGRRSGQEVYARERDRHSRAGLELVGQLPAAFAAGQLEAFFQPKADAGSRAVVGFEALVRWRHPEHGLLAPAAFVPLAEQAGLARQLTRCVLEQALAACRGWRAGGHDLHVAVNASVSDLLDTSLPGEVHAALLRHGLPPEALVLELTEGSVMSDPTRIGEVLERLAALGVGLSLDDFGTGYSSLLHLKTLPVGEVKIDRSFVTGALHDAKDAAIVRATIELARELGMRTVAEGVEDGAVWERLAALGCEVIQGYALSRPVPAADAAALIAGADAPVSRARSAVHSRA